MKSNINPYLAALLAFVLGLVVQAIFSPLPCGSNCQCNHQAEEQPGGILIGPES